MAAFPPRDKDSFMTHWGKVLADHSIIKKAVLYRGRLAGNIVCFEQGGKSLVGYWIGMEFWGKGIASRALTMFLDHVKQRPIYARVAKHNAGSIRVLEKSGFSLSGEDTATDIPFGVEVEEFIFQLGE